MGPTRPWWTRWSRAFRVRLATVGYVGRRLLPPLLAVIAYTVLAAVVVRWDLARHGATLPDFEATLYGLYTQLFFEPTDAFPAAEVARFLFWVTPVVGLFLIAEGLVKVGASIFDLAARREVWVTIVTGQMRNHIVVCGLGHVGYRVVEELRCLGEDVVAIEKDEAGSFVQSVRAMSIPVHVGDGRRDDLLAGVGMERAKAVVCATGDDLANLEIALDAKKINPSIRVVMRMFDQRLAGKVGGALELEQSFSTSSLAAPLIAMQASHDRIHAAYRLGDIVRVTAEVVVGGSFAPVPIGDLEQRVPCRIVSRRPARGAEFVPARADDPIERGDVLVIDTAALELSGVLAQLGAS